MNQKARRIRLAAYSCWLVTFTSYALLLWLGSAEAAYFSLKVSDNKRIDLSFDLELDVKYKIENEDSLEEIRIGGLEDWSDYYSAELYEDYSTSITASDKLSCREYFDNSARERDNVLFFRAEIFECLEVTVVGHPLVDMRRSEWHFWYPECPCFVQMITFYPDESKDTYNYIVQPVIDSFREAYSKPFADSTAASRLIAARDPTIPKDAIDIAEVQRQIGEAQRRTRDAKQKRAQLIARLRARLEEKERQEKIPDNQVAFTIKNSTGKDLHVKFFEFKTRKSDSLSRVYPSHERAWHLAEGQQDDFRLTCTPGRFVCYGAEFKFDRMWQSGVRWGVSLDGNLGCPDCCLRCGGKAMARSLIWNGKRHPPSVARRRGGGDDGTAETLGAILGIVGGAIIGSQSAPAYQPAPTYRRPPSAYPRPPAPRRAPRQSDISR